MTKKYIFLGLALFLVASLMACKKFLEIKSDKRLVVPKTLVDIQGLLDDADRTNLRTTPSYGETSADDYFLQPTALNVFGTVGRDVYVWKDIAYRYGNDWSQAYQIIYNANLSLELLAAVERNPANQIQWDNIKGSALFYRAFYNLALLAQFGLAYDEQQSEVELGIVLRKSSDFNIPSKRASVKECFEEILADLTAAIKYLPLHPQHVMRPSQPAALALLARAHLYKRDYAKALSYADAAITLMPTLMDFNSDTDINSLTAAIPFKRFNKEVIFYTEMTNGFSLHVSNRANVDTTLYESYQNNDLRKVAFFLATGKYQRFKGSYASHATALFSGLAVDELYLTKAESMAASGNFKDGLNVLNFFLKKRWRNSVSFIPITAFSEAEALAKIRTERRKSLLMRNLRWMDIKRQNKEGAAITLTRKIDGVSFNLLPNAPFYALPLPIDIIEQTGIPQN